MHYGITYRNRHSDELGIITKTKSRPPMPPPRIVEETVLYRDGSLDYSEWSGRTFYDDKLLEIEFTVPSCDLKELNAKVSKIVAWLGSGFGKLAYDDMPGVRWLAKPINLDNLALEIFRVGSTVVQFRCKPFNEFLHDNTDIPIGSEMMIGSSVPIGYGYDAVQSLYSGSNTIKIGYVGDAPCRPSITLTGNAKSFDIQKDGVRLFVKLPSRADYYGGVVLDCENWVCLGGNGSNLTLHTDGDFFELSPGNNTFSVLADSAGSVEFSYYPKFMYGENCINEND